MKKVMMSLLAVGLITSSVWAYNPYAPNPFDVVEKKSQAYIYVKELTEAGLTGVERDRVSPTYPLTRYEMVKWWRRPLQIRIRRRLSRLKKWMH